ncbi:transposase [Nonomuraea sp. NPDC059023]|uniref:transposase n=1 Tax=unclassified Nonomuraea TaxID=2593643 RepID=UPI0036809E0C
MMESMGKKPRPRRSFTPEFKAEIVELCWRGDRSVGRVAKDFDLTETAVRDRVRQAEVDFGRRDGLTSTDREKLAALSRENRRLREDVAPGLICSPRVPGVTRKSGVAVHEQVAEAEAVSMVTLRATHASARCAAYITLPRVSRVEP